MVSCKYVNLKPGRVGGLTPAVAIHNAGHRQGPAKRQGNVKQLEGVDLHLRDQGSEARG